MAATHGESVIDLARRIPEAPAPAQVIRPLVVCFSGLKRVDCRDSFGHLGCLLTVLEVVVELACLDLEGVLVPEIWIEFAKVTGIEELKATTRDIPDYDVLMKQRLRILEQHKLGLKEIQDVIATLKPLDGAVEFVDWLRERFQVIILSDTFYEFSQPLMRQLGFPTLLCHRLNVDERGMVVGYTLRQRDPKRQSVLALKTLYYRVIAAGDSYNDTTMLGEADQGILFHAPQNVIEQFPQFPAVHTYEDLKKEFIKASNRELSL
jgi:phosphoserine/homoserine phosphotransferase